MEVVECDNVTTTPLPSKLLDTATIRCARSQDDLACCDSAVGGGGRSPWTAELSACSDMPLVENDENEGWTIEDDDIIQASGCCCCVGWGVKLYSLTHYCLLLALYSAASPAPRGARDW